MATRLAQEGYVVVVPTYELYPKALVPDMVRNGLVLNIWVHCCCCCVPLACDAARPWVPDLQEMHTRS